MSANQRNTTVPSTASAGPKSRGLLSDDDFKTENAGDVDPATSPSASRINTSGAEQHGRKMSTGQLSSEDFKDSDGGHGSANDAAV